MSDLKITLTHLPSHPVDKTRVRFAPDDPCNSVRRAVSPQLRKNPQIKRSSSLPSLLSGLRGDLTSAKWAQDVDRLRQIAAKIADAESLQSLGEIFIRRLHSSLRSFNKTLPSGLRTQPEFVPAFQATIYFGVAFSGQVQRLQKPAPKDDPVDVWQVSLVYLELIMTYLKRLAEIIKQSDPSPMALDPNHKPLPQVPIGSTIPPDGIIFENSSTSTTEPPAASTDSYYIVHPNVLEQPVPPITSRPSKGSLRRLMPRIRKKPTMPLTIPTYAISSESTTTLQLSPHSEMFHYATDSGGSQSSDTLFSEGSHSSPPEDKLEVTHPQTTEDTYYSQGGVLCAAKIAALLRILTSKEAVIDPTFQNVFFLSFRFFSSPAEVFENLVNRYNEEPPQNLTEAQTVTWAGNAVTTKIRVAKVFLTWLKIHWCSKRDDEIIEPLRKFASERSAGDPALAIWGQVLGILVDASKCDVYNDDRIQRSLQQSVPAADARRSHTFMLLTQNDVLRGNYDSVDILHFHSVAGREELACQLSIAASRFYRNFDPEDAVQFWANRLDKDVGKKIKKLTLFENALVYWTADAILAKPTVRSRAETMEFFVDLASECLKLRNFACAYSTISGVNLCMNRLRETTEALSDEHKEIVKDLLNLFSLRNRKSYRALLASGKGPTVPLLSMFEHDIEIAFSMEATREHPEQPGTVLIDLSRYRIIARTIEAMESCHRTYNYDRSRCIFRWLSHVLSDYEKRSYLEHIARLDDLSNKLEPKRSRS